MPPPDPQRVTSQQPEPQQPSYGGTNPRIDNLNARFGLQPSQVPANAQTPLVPIGKDARGNPIIVPADMAKQLWPQMNKKELNVLFDKVEQYYPGWSGNVSWMNKFVNQMIDRASANYMVNGDDTPYINTLDSFLAAARERYGPDLGTGGGGGGGGAPTAVVNLTDPGTAKQLINQSLQNYLGRRATNRELRKFVDALNEAEMGAPRTQGVSGGVAVTAGGFNPATFAEDYAMGMEGSGEFQAVTNYLNAFIGSLENPLGV